MVLEEIKVEDFSSMEEMVEHDKQFPNPTNKAYFDITLVKEKNNQLTSDAVSFLNDYFTTRTGMPLLTNMQYFINIHVEDKKQGDYGLEERDGFTEIRTIVCVSNIIFKKSFTISYTTTSNMIMFSFEDNIAFDRKNLLDKSKKELMGFIDNNTYYTLAFAEVVYNYLEHGIVDLDVGVGSIKTH